LVADLLRYDGKLLFETPGLNTRLDALDKGLILRIPDPDGKIQDAINEYFRINGAPRSLDCAAGLCKVLTQSAGVQLPGTFIDQVMPHKLMRRLIDEGASTADGRRIDVHVFMIGNGTPELVLKAAERAMYKQMSDLANKGKDLAQEAVERAAAKAAEVSSLISSFFKKK
jgi:hypothetical protein